MGKFRRCEMYLNETENFPTNILKSNTENASENV